MIEVNLSALLTFLREQNVLMSFLLPKNFFTSSETTGKLLAGRLFITVTEFLIFELTLPPVFHFSESNSENVTFELSELEAAYLMEREEDRLRGVGTESRERQCFVVIVDEEHVEEDEKHIKFLLTLVGKEITNLGNAKLSMSFLLVNNFLISSGILVLTHALTAEAVTGGPAMVETEFTESKCSEKIVDEKVEEEDG